MLQPLDVSLAQPSWTRTGVSEPTSGKDKWVSVGQQLLTAAQLTAVMGHNSQHKRL